MLKNHLMIHRTVLFTWLKKGTKFGKPSYGVPADATLSYSSVASANLGQVGDAKFTATEVFHYIHRSGGRQVANRILSFETAKQNGVDEKRPFAEKP